MSEFFKDKPSSRVLRPPGGASSNIFGGPDGGSESRSTSVKPTYKSSVFDSEPEPAKPAPTNRQGPPSSGIFPTEPETHEVPLVKKVSKTQISSIFQEPEQTSNGDKQAYGPISGIPMFTSSTQGEVRRPLRRPITAPTHIESCMNSTMVAKNPVGQRKKVLAATSAARYDPITGKVLGRPDSASSESGTTTKPVSNSAPSPEKATTTAPEEPMKNNEPHLGPVKNDSGVRCAQPPGGRSTLSLF